MKLINVKNNYLFILLIIFIILLIFLLLYYDIEINETIDYENTKYNIQTDGIQILYEPDYLEPSEQLKHNVLSILPPNYVFLDYVYKISGNSLSTFHRDVTSSSKIYITEYPVYTMIIYKTDGELLSFCPNSHNTYPFVWSSIVNITGKAGTVFLFDSELLHAGSSDNCENRKAIQYKICHINDITKLSHLHGVDAKKETVCTESTLMKWLYRIFRKISYYFEMPINTIFYPIMIEKKDGIIGWIQDIIPIKYYNNI